MKNSTITLITKEEAFLSMKNGKKIQHIDWLEGYDGLGKYWFYRMDYNEKIVDQDGDLVAAWDDFVGSESSWQVYPDFDYEAHENLIVENKNMAEYLESLGYSQAQISDLALFGWKHQLKTKATQKDEIQLLQAEVAGMEKDGMANINAIERFNRKIKSLQNHSVITVEAMDEISTKSKQSAMDDIYSSFPEDMGTEELWETIMTNDEFNHDDLVICEKYECCSIDIIREQLDIISSVYEKYALEIINLVKPIQTQNTLLLYKTSVQELSEDVIVMLDGESDYVATGLGRGSMIFDLDTLKTILSSYEEDTGDEEAPDIGSDSSYLEFSALIEKVAMNGCKGLLLTNGGNHE